MNPSNAIGQALWASLYVSPRDHGLTMDELVAVLAPLGLKRGEIGDAATHWRPTDNGRLLPRDDAMEGAIFLNNLEHDPRNVDAFQFVVDHFTSLAREYGAQQATSTRDTIVAAAALEGISSHDTDVALASYGVMSAIKAEADRLRPAQGRLGSPRQTANQRRSQAQRRPHYPKLLESVRDVISRRTDGRPRAAEALPAFGEMLQALGHGRFQAWWAQTVSELRQADDARTPTTVCVLAASLVEAALIFIMKRARDLSLGTLAISALSGDDPKRWSINDLIKGAAAGGADAVFDQKTRDMADVLTRTRQRIHAGRLMSDHPVGPIPDLRPEEARDARASLDRVVRAILDWIEKHPAP